MMEWKCDNCGACCRAKNCERYTTEGKCAIYEDRPSHCRSAVMNKVLRPDLKWDDFIELSKIYCKFLREIEDFNRRIK